MKTYLKYIFIAIFMILILLAVSSCKEKNNGNLSGDVVENSELSEGDVPDMTPTDENSESEDTTVDIIDVSSENTVENTTETVENDVWYVKDGSVQTEFELGEKFNYKNIVVIHYINGEIIGLGEHIVKGSFIPLNRFGIGEKLRVDKLKPICAVEDRRIAPPNHHVAHPRRRKLAHHEVCDQGRKLLPADHVGLSLAPNAHEPLHAHGRGAIGADRRPSR